MSFALVDSARSCVKRVAAVVFALAAVFVSSEVWAVPFWQSEMTVGGYAGSSTLESFPLLVRISPSAIDGFSYDDCAPGGADISFALGDGTLLPHDIDTWNTDGESLVWVKVPSLSGKATKLKFRWKDDAPAANSPADVWKANYAGVWHMAETTAGATVLADAAGNQDGTAHKNSLVADGIVGKARGRTDATGKNGATMTVPKGDVLDALTPAFTVSGWFKPTTTSGSWAYLYSRKDADGYPSWGWQIRASGTPNSIAVYSSGSADNDTQRVVYGTTSKFPQNKWRKYDIVYTSTDVTFYLDGESLGTKTILPGAAKNGSLDFTLGGLNGSGHGTMQAYFDETRLCKNVLSADWVKAEYDQVTSASFVTAGAAEVVSTKSINISSSLLPYGTVQPDYGVIREPVADQEYVFTCTQTELPLVEGRTKAVCTGWKLSRLSDGVLIKSSADTGEDPYVCRHVYAQGVGVNLQWQWVIRHKVVATAGAGGTVDKAEQWADDGTDVTITATAGEGARFLNWHGDSTAFVTPLTLTRVTKPMTVVANFCPADWNVTYASPKADESGTGSASAPFKSVQKAIDAAGAGGIVLLAAGTYGSATSLVLTNGVSLVGGASTNTAVVLELTASNDKTKNVLQILSSSSSVVTNLTLTNGNRQDGSGVEMDSGLITHCVIRDCKTANLSDHGGGVNMTGGIVRRCDIVNCDAQDSGGGGKYGGGVYMKGGTVEFCTIRKCKQSAYGSDGRGGGVYIDWSGTLRNCLVTGCKSYRYGSGVCAFGGTVENCTIVGNTQCSSSAGATGLYAQGTVLRNNIIWGNTKHDGVTAADVSTSSLTAANVYNNNSPTAISVGSNNIAVNPQFVNAAAGDYRLGYSDCVNGGSNQTWMATATDLDGRPRLVKNIVDIGCYERAASSGLECKFTVTTAKTLDTATATVKAEVDGDDTGLVYYWTFTRVADGKVVRLVGDDYRENFTYDFPAGVWNARLDVTNATPSSAFSKIEGAMDVRASVAYAGKSGNAVYPYATLEDASSSVNDAFAVLGEGGVLYIDEGDYTIVSQLALSSGKGTKIVSLKGPSKTSIRLGNVSAFTSQGYRGLVLAKAAAWLEGLTIAGGQKGPQYSGSAYGTYGLVEMTASGATMTNCVLRDANAASYGAGFNGLALKISGGGVHDCAIQNISAYGSGGAGVIGGTVWMSGGTLDRVVIARCRTTGTSSVLVKGDIVYQEGGEIRNSLITGCTTLKSVPIGVDGGRFYNCTVACNTNTAVAFGMNGETKFYNDLTAGVTVHSGTVKNCIITGNRSTVANCVTNIRGSVTYTLVDDRTTLEGEGNKVGDPKFYLTAGKTWQIRSSSPALNAGTVLPWMTETSVDLGGKPRIRNRAPDMGCYEGDAAGLLLIVR